MPLLTTDKRAVLKVDYEILKSDSLLQVISKTIKTKKKLSNNLKKNIRKMVPNF